jgi:signal recognition particle subunit SRP54
MRAVTGKPIKLLGVGEKWDALEDFHPQRIAGRILGMGDVVSLVEKAAQTIDAEKAQAIAQKMRKGSFDFEDLLDQLGQLQKLGGMSSMLGMLPGIGKVKKQIDAAGGVDDGIIKRQRAIIQSMTKKERRNPKILDGKRKRRIASGSGTKVEEINRLIKMHRQMADMMKTMGKRGGLMQRMMGGGGAGPSPAEIERMQAELATLDPKALDSLPKELKESLPKGLPGFGGGAPKLPGLPGLGGGGPRLPGLPGFPGKKK